MPSLGVADKGKKFLVAAKTCKKGMYECIVYKDHSTCTCQCYRFNNICKHSLCVSEIEGILKGTLGLSFKVATVLTSVKKQSCRAGQGRTRGGAHKNSWRPRRGCSGQKHPFTEIHHNNQPFVVGFLDDQPNAKECRHFRAEFPRRQQIVPFDIILSHQEKCMDVPFSHKSQDQASVYKVHHKVLLCKARMHYIALSLFPVILS